MANEFLTDIQTLRKRARQHIENGAVTEGYTARPRDGDPAS